MSAAADRMREARAALKVAEAENLRATLAPASYKEAVKAKAKQLAKDEQRYADNAVAVASGKPECLSLPDAQAMEKLRAEIAVAPLVEQQLETAMKGAKLALERAKREADTANGAFLHVVSIAPALEEFRHAFNVLGDAAVRLMAAHRKAYPHENSNSWDPTYAATFGPVGELLTAMHGMDWPSTYRYDVRPSWLPRHGAFFAGEMAGMLEAMRDVDAALQEGVAA